MTLWADDTYAREVASDGQLGMIAAMVADLANHMGVVATRVEMSPDVLMVLGAQGVAVEIDAGGTPRLLGLEVRVNTELPPMRVWVH